jgi:hypothetical protein
MPSPIARRCANLPTAAGQPHEDVARCMSSPWLVAASSRRARCEGWPKLAQAAARGRPEALMYLEPVRQRDGPTTAWRSSPVASLQRKNASSNAGSSSSKSSRASSSARKVFSSASGPASQRLRSTRAPARDPAIGLESTVAAVGKPAASSANAARRIPQPGTLLARYIDTPWRAAPSEVIRQVGAASMRPAIWQPRQRPGRRRVAHAPRGRVRQLRHLGNRVPQDRAGPRSRFPLGRARVRYEHAHPMDFSAAAARWIDAFLANVEWHDVAARMAPPRA